MSDEEKIFTLEEVAETLRVSTRTIQREVKTGKLKAFKVGHALRFKANDLAEYQRNQAVELVQPRPGRPKKAEE